MTPQEKEKKAALWRTPKNPRWKDGKGRERELVNRVHRLKSHKQIRIDYILAEKQGKPCADCGGFFPPCCMDFDHIDPSTKYENINGLKTAKMEILIAEIKKCELVCANCHRIRTTKRKRGIPLNEPFVYGVTQSVTETKTA